VTAPTRTASATSFDRRLIAPLILGSVLNPINSSIIAVSLIPIGLAFGAKPSQTAWLVSALYLATAIGQPVVGRLVDLYGPRRLYLIGTGLVGVAGTLGMLAPTLGVLIAARVLLGFGTCAGYPSAMYLIRSESTRTGQQSPNGVLTVLAVANQTIAVIGPTLGGLLILAGGWRATLAVNIPLSLACLVLGSRRLPRERPVRDARDHARFDLAGAALFACALIAMLLFLMGLRSGLWWLLPVALGVGAAFVAVEHRTAQPFIDLRVLSGNAPLVATYVRNLLAAIVSYSFLYGFTQWLQDGRGLTPTQSGLVLLPMFATAVLVSSTTGRRPQVRGKLIVGAATQIAASAILLLIGAGSAVWVLLGLTLLLGVPQGLNNLANQNALYHQADPERMGSSAGLLRTSLYLGAIVAAAANGAFLANGATTAGLHGLSVFLIAVSGLSLVVTVADRSIAKIGRS
jgi:MFS family permease